MWQESAAELEQVDVAPALARLMAPKDSTEVTNIKRAAHLSSAVLEKFVVAKIEAVVDDAGKVRILASNRTSCCITHSLPHAPD